jgi:hypothetical protein
MQPPKVVAKIGVADVVRVEPGPERDKKIHEWAAAVWESWNERRGEVVELVRRELGVQ